MAKKDASDLKKSALAGLRKKLGGSTSSLDETTSKVRWWYSTGSVILDTIITNNPANTGGIPSGKLTEISGQESTGKSLMAYYILKDCQDQGGYSILVDVESSMNEAFCRVIGLNLEDLIIINESNVEDIFPLLELAVKEIRKEDKDAQIAIVWDSYAQSSSKIEIENDYDDRNYSPQVKALNLGLRKFMPIVQTEQIAFVILNQLRMKIPAPMFGDKYQSPGGKAIPFASSLRLRLYHAGYKTKGKGADKEVLGQELRAVVQKSKLGPPQREINLHLYFNEGLVDEQSWMEYLKNKDLFEKVSSQKSAVDLDGKYYEWKNAEFSTFIKDPENSPLREFILDNLKEMLYRPPITNPSSDESVITSILEVEDYTRPEDENDAYGNDE